jgi:hypothetical protein
MGVGVAGHHGHNVQHLAEEVQRFDFDVATILNL